MPDQAKPDQAQAKPDPEPTAQDVVKYLAHNFPDFKAWVKEAREAEAKKAEADKAAPAQAHQAGRP